MKRYRIAVMAISFLVLGHLVGAQVPQILNYQGRVAVNGTNFDGTGQFQFAFVDGTGATTYWSNGNGLVSLPVAGGLYSVLLGDTTVTNMAAIPAAVFTNTDVRLRVWFNGGAGLQQLSPDQRFTAVGYALMAATVPNGAITSSQLAIGAVTSANIANNTITAANMAPGAGVVPASAFVLSQTLSNASLTAAGYTPLTTNFFLSAGTNWTQLTHAAAWSGRYEFGAVAFNGRIWVLGGYNGSNTLNDVWNSSDGTNWTQVTNAAPWSARYGLTVAVFNGQMWAFGGQTQFGGGSYLNDVWSTLNGTNWTKVTAAAPWSDRTTFGATVFNGRMWVFGGNASNYLNDVWSTLDGTNWTQATAAAPWSPRTSLGAVAFNGQMWVLGGYNGGYHNDVWSSSDGTNWMQATSAASWSPRNGLGTAAFNGRMWVLGGNIGGNFNDVWSTLDGTNWTQVTSAAPWSIRGWGGTVVYNGQMWVLGGGCGGSCLLNDVWSSPGSETISIPVQLGQFFLFQKQ